MLEEMKNLKEDVEQLQAVVDDLQNDLEEVQGDITEPEDHVGTDSCVYWYKYIDHCNAINLTNHTLYSESKQTIHITNGNIFHFSCCSSIWFLSHV